MNKNDHNMVFLSGDTIVYHNKSFNNHQSFNISHAFCFYKQGFMLLISKQFHAQRSYYKCTVSVLHIVHYDSMHIWLIHAYVHCCISKPM